MLNLVYITGMARHDLMLERTLDRKPEEGDKLRYRNLETHERKRLLETSLEQVKLYTCLLSIV